MRSIETIQHLRWHAGLEKESDFTAPSIAACTWPPSDLSSGLGDAITDCLVVLSRFNIELNGAVHSMDHDQADEIPRRAAYAVAEIIRLLREYGDALGVDDDGKQIMKWVKLVEAAWLAVLAGDIDDLMGHLQYEEAARGQQN